MAEFKDREKMLMLSMMPMITEHIDELCEDMKRQQDEGIADYAMLAMVEKNLGICIVPELLLHGTNHRVKVMELSPPAKRTIGIALPQYESAPIMVHQFADFIVNWVNNKKQKESM